jgi:hypothetical protein
MYGTPFLLVVVNNNLIDLVNNRIRAKRGSFSSPAGIVHGQLCCSWQRDFAWAVWWTGVVLRDGYVR